MAAPVAIATPRYITTAGFGCLFQDYGTGGPASAAEPSIMTKFFGLDQNGRSESYREEKDSHAQVIQRVGNIPDRITSAFGLDLDYGNETRVTGYRVNFPQRWGPGIYSRDLPTEYPDTIPSLVCETPNHSGSKLRHRVDSERDPADAGARLYRVVKMANMGNTLYDEKPLRFMCFYRILDQFVLFHSGMIHNDVKGNNILYNPASALPAIIDFGLCKPYIPGGPIPYRDRVTNVIQQTWFAYPPEYIFTSDDGALADPAALDVAWIRQFIDGANSGTAIHPLCDPRLPREDPIGGGPAPAISIEDRVRGAWVEAYNDYFNNPAISQEQKILQTSITGDMYAIGIELYKNWIEANDAYVSRPFNLGTAMSMGEFLIKISTLMCNHHPRLRPFPINILRLYNAYYPPHGHPVTHINVQTAAGPVPYYDCIALGGDPVDMTVAEGMALGIGNCPISAQEVEDNLTILYFLVNKSYQDMFDYISFYLTYDPILAEARAYLAANPSPAFPPPPPPAPPAPPVAPAAPAGLPPPPPGAPPALPVAPGFVAIGLGSPGGGLGGPPPAVGRGRFRAALAAVGAVFGAGGGGGAGAAAPAAPAFGSAGAVVGGKRRGKTQRQRGGLAKKSTRAQAYLDFVVTDKNSVIRSLLQSGILSPGSYFSLTHGNANMASLIRKVQSTSVQKGGKTNKKNPCNNSTKKLNRTPYSLVRTNNILRNYRNSQKQIMYSSFQNKAILQHVRSAPAAGKINLLHQYYISNLADTEQEEILASLLFCPLADSALVTRICEDFAKGDVQAVRATLNAQKAAQLSSLKADLTLDIQAAEGDIGGLVRKYRALKGDEMYNFLHNTVDALVQEPESAVKPVSKVMKKTVAARPAAAQRAVVA